MSSQVDLVHPLYLDVPMLVSFLATLEDGLSYSSEVAQVAEVSSGTTAEGSGAAKLPGLTSLLGLSLSLSGKLIQDEKVNDRIETKLVRQHTAASLFNKLRQRLYQDSSVQRVRSQKDLERVVSGSIVEVSGAIYESPLLRLVTFVNGIFPFVEENATAQLKKIPNIKRNRKGGLTPEERAVADQIEEAKAAMQAELEQNQDIMRMVKLIEQDLSSSKLVDMVVQGEGVAGFLALHRDFMTDDLVDGILGGTFKIMGKVSATNAALDARAPVVRRGVMGTMPEKVIEDMLDSMRSTDENAPIRLDLPEGQLRGPHLQLIPLAIFV